MINIKISQRTHKTINLEGKKEIGCFLVHGFTGTPGEMEPLAKFLNSQGYAVYAPLLAGHGTSPEDLSQTSAEEILESARRGLNKISHCKKKVLMGLSMGGLISGLLARDGDVDGLVFMGTPVYMVDRSIYLSPFIKPLKPYIKKDSSNNDYPLEPTTYNWIPTRAVSQLLRLRKDFIASLPEITAPSLILHGAYDEKVKVESMDYIYHNLGSEKKAQVLLEASHHIVTLDKERNKVFQNVEKFLTGL